MASAHEVARAMATTQHEISVEMVKVAEAHDAAVAGRDAALERLTDAKDELATARLQSSRLTQRLHRLELVQDVQQRIADGTLVRPEKPLTDMTIQRLKRLAEAPVVVSRRSWRGRR